ncbi:MAG: helix-turn-helix transcriptional regulator [Blastocatellia bacterium]
MNRAGQPSLREIFARNLRRLRQHRKISQEQMAEMADLHRTYISSVERGERNISIDNIEKLAQALEVDVCDLFSVERHNETSPGQRKTR